MDKKLLAERLQYPAIWVESGLFSDDLYELQLREYEEEYGSEVPDGGTEHWRYGAFNYVLRRNPDEKTLRLLLDAAIADPDLPMAGAAIRDIMDHLLSTREMLAQAVAAVDRSRDYHVSARDLERRYVERSTRK